MDYKELMSAEHVAQLRTKFFKYSASYSMSEVSKAVGITRPTMYRFIQGKRVYSFTVRKIMRWCEKMNR